MQKKEYPNKCDTRQHLDDSTSPETGATHNHLHKTPKKEKWSRDFPFGSVESSLQRPSAWSRLAPTPLVAREPSPALLAQTRRSTTPPALPRLPSVPPWTGRPPSREHRTKERGKKLSLHKSQRGRRKRESQGEGEERAKRRRRRRKQREERSRPCACPSFIEPVLRPLLRPSPRPVLGSTSLRGISRSLSKGGVPSLRPPHAVR